MSLRKYLGRCRRAFASFRDSLVYAARYEMLGRFRVPKPTVVQFAVNDICNSKCVMCNIWMRKRDHEFTIPELDSILRDPLFRDVRYVGITGGEPTMRKDLPEIAETLLRCLPRMQSFGVITNAIVEKSVTERVLACHQAAQRSGRTFAVAISLDGVGDDHDRNRGVKGNFDSAMTVMEALRAGGMRPAIGCTLTPTNCDGADDLLRWLERSDIETWTFRLGVEIKRVYNDGWSQSSPFTQEQVFHLAQFFEKLAHHPRVHTAHQLFYKSLVGQLVDGAPRRAGCDWRFRGVTLDTRGGISYCSVQSPILGTALEESGWEIYRKNAPKRAKILEEHCDSCMHDLRGPLPVSIAASEFAKVVAAPFVARIRNWTSNERALSLGHVAPSPPRGDARAWKSVLITGWYGTETTGDKAILAELLHRLKQSSPEARIHLTTLDAHVSRQTLRELPDGAGVALVPFREGISAARNCDATVIGGGPLMGIEPIRTIERMFYAAYRAGRERILFGCGVGPFRGKSFEASIANICRLASLGFLRDQESLTWARDTGADAPLTAACDPAMGYLARWRQSSACDGDHSTEQTDKRIVGLLRANTGEYVPSDDLAKHNSEAAGRLAETFAVAADSSGCRIDLVAMNCPDVGGDDRLFNRDVRDATEASRAFEVQRAYLTLDQTTSRVASAQAAAAMRYHGHLFCIGLGVPFVSFDYTQGGKVRRLIDRLAWQDRAFAWREFDPQHVGAKLAALANEPTKARLALEAARVEMTDALDAACRAIFDPSDAPRATMGTGA